MGFIKYLHIENIDSKNKFIVTEKIDGSNISFIFENGKLKNSASRNLVCNNFHGCFDIIKNEPYKSFFENLKKYLIDNNINNFNLFGEIYGNNIQRNIMYCKDNKLQIRFFGAISNDKYISFKNLIELFQICSIEWEILLVPIIEITDNVFDCYNKYKNTIDTLTSEVAKKNLVESNEIIEGVIIQPFDYFNEHQIYKLKSKKYQEVSKNGKTFLYNKINDKISCRELKKIFDNYLTKNRLQNILSHGYTDIKKQLIDIYKEFINDAFNEMISDYDLKSDMIDKKQKREIIDNRMVHLKKLLKDLNYDV